MPLNNSTWLSARYYLSYGDSNTYFVFLENKKLYCLFELKHHHRLNKNNLLIIFFFLCIFSNQIRRSSRLSLAKISYLINQPIQLQITSGQEEKKKEGENWCLLLSLISSRMNAFIWLVVTLLLKKKPEHITNTQIALHIEP